MIWAKVCIFAAFCLSAPHFFKKEFKHPPIHAEIAFNPEWEMPINMEVLKILNQPFCYLTKGNQTTVFLSQDGKYVIKIFRYKTTLFPVLQTVKNLFKKKGKKIFQVKMEKTLCAAFIGCNEGKEFTQGIYCHLNITENKLPKLRLRIGKKQLEISLDKTRFILQKRARGFKESILLAKNNTEEMRALIDSFVSLLQRRFSQSIRNSDPNVGPNFGFIDQHAVEIDFGNYQKTEPNPERERAEFVSYIRRFETILQKLAPDYVEYLHRKRSIPYDQKK